MNNKKKTVLVIDDEEPIRILISAALKRLAADTDVILADSPLKAIKMAENKKPDLIISDLAMPEMDGIQVCTAIRLNPVTKDIPFILLTGSSKTDDIDRAYEAGISDYILKPINFDRFRLKISKLI
ncbi:MAG: response regulator [Elusimicrobiota bacterium]